MSNTNTIDCGKISENNKLIKGWHFSTFDPSRYTTVNKIIVKKNLIEKLSNTLQELLDNIDLKAERKLIRECDGFADRKKNLRIHVGNFGEMMVASIMGLTLLAGTTSRGADAVLLNENKFLKQGRYQIKYRDATTSDIAFRMDWDKKVKGFPKGTEWEYLLIATHLHHQIVPNRFYCIPVKKAMQLSEVISNKSSVYSSSDKGANKYLKLRINWTSKRKGKGNVGRKCNCISNSSFKLEGVNLLDFQDVVVADYR